jgi:Domain of unknown function (DUF3597)
VINAVWSYGPLGLTPRQAKENIMSIFGALKSAIFGTGSQAPPAGAAKSQAAPAPAPPSAGTATQQPSPTQTSPPVSGPNPAVQVDIEAVLTAMAARKPEKLNWQSSIVDLMKLVDLDPSLENRKTLASELGYPGDTRDSAAMNIWLHRQVMLQLEAAGGKVPDSLRHQQPV